MYQLTVIFLINRSFCPSTGRRLLLRGIGMHDIEVWSRLRVHHGDIRSFHSLYAPLGRVHDCQTVFTSHRSSHIQPVRAETNVHRL